MIRSFDSQVKDALLASGWRMLAAPDGLSLGVLRAAGAPFKGSKYFDQHAAAVREAPVAAGEVAYRPGLLPDSLNQSYAAAEDLVRRLAPLLPAGARPIVGPAALYAWLLWEHYRQYGEWPIAQCYTWASELAGGAHLAVGVFGRERPLLVSPIPEGSGRGLGVMPLVLPAGP